MNSRLISSSLRLVATILVRMPFRNID